MIRLLPVTGVFILAGLPAFADYANAVASDRPVAHWRLTQPVQGAYPAEGGVILPAEAEGNVETVPGPLADSFPEFTNDNRAIRLAEKGAVIRVADPGPDSPFDFRLGDSITLEAWVRCDKISDGQQSYIIGKGRTQNPGFASSNQNW